MAVEEVLWKRDAHTKAKHELLLAFFNKWVLVVPQRNPLVALKQLARSTCSPADAS
jgi:hypothetical protein